MSNNPLLSIVIPAYNEEKRIGNRLGEVIAYLEGLNLAYELIIVDDGSTDATVGVVNQATSGNSNARILQNEANRGKGAAVRKGMLDAQGEYVLFTDADLSTPIAELDQVWTWFEQAYDVVIGSRRTSGARIEGHQPWLRESMGRVFTRLTNLLVTKERSDVTCGFKCFRRPVARDLFSQQRLDDWSFDAEILSIASKHGYRIKEIPVHWHDDPATKVRLFRDTISSLLGLLRIRLNDYLGRYDVLPTAQQKAKLQSQKAAVVE
jgi:dolichyl-phosphate beta-glucosyltransferase